MAWSLPQANVLVPWNFSRGCEEALEAALTMVGQPADVTVLHVVEPVGAIATMGETRNRDAQDALAATLQRVRDTLDAAGHTDVGASVRFGVAHEAIAASVAEHGHELVVMPSQRKTGVRRLLLGSVTEQVLRSVPVPVLVLRAPLSDES